ncbi:MAG: hypothetical protein IJC26_07635, partial [Clostridia bacterium]|nr:hypothetical protein [Clostridia bacterium]
MKTNHTTLETIFATVCFSVINSLFLVAHFSKLGCAALALAIAFCVVRVNLFGSRKGTYTVVRWIPTYLAVLMISASAIVFLEQELYQQKILFSAINVERLFVPAIILFVGFLLMKNWNFHGDKNDEVKFYLKNILLLGELIGISSFFIRWEWEPIIVFSALIVVVGMVLDSLSGKTDGFVAGTVIMVLFTLLCIF